MHKVGGHFHGRSRDSVEHDYQPERPPGRVAGGAGCGGCHRDRDRDRIRVEPLGSRIAVPPVHARKELERADDVSPVRMDRSRRLCPGNACRLANRLPLELQVAGEHPLPWNSTFAGEAVHRWRDWRRWIDGFLTPPGAQGSRREMPRPARSCSRPPASRGQPAGHAHCAEPG